MHPVQRPLALGSTMRVPGGITAGRSVQADPTPETDKVYRHPAGLIFHHPADGSGRAHADIIQLVPV